MRQTDIAIIGGGLAGSTAAAMLGRAGIAALLIEPHDSHPPELRCEKISGDQQLDRLRETGLAEAALRISVHDAQIWIARFGRLIDIRPSQQYGFMYDALVNAIRAEIPAAVEHIRAKATAVVTSDDRQIVTLSNGEQVSARLVVLAHGPSVALYQALGIERRVISACHSISVGFDIAPVGRAAFAFPSLTYFSERTALRTAYLTLFPVAHGTRANLFVYREMDDPWLRQMRREPAAALDACLPQLRAMIGDYAISGDIRIRPVDLYVSSGHRQAGIVLVGDAFASPCPGSGTGTDKVFTDVTQLCNVHIPRWLATPGMDVAKIAAFYDDPVKQECDAWAEAKAFTLRAVTLDNSLFWRAQRWARFFGRLGQGMVRRMRETMKPSAALRIRTRSS
ncbi:FAD-dependent monooxygenase [Rhodopseudomonas sp. RCAM05734]|uniref:FAD-dependent monooxygenase n=1 Tax=Rhodopseudomonas sp. RCAM05734 TaxID=3457549 RepID=UPI004043B380